MKRCSKCREVRAVADFHIDRSRADGRSYVCRSCRDPRTKTGPTKPERQAMRAIGLHWCRGCKGWLPSPEVRAGVCVDHANIERRALYRENVDYRQRVKERSAQRWRGVSAVPIAGAEALTEMFGGLCAYCYAPAACWDHVTPASKGGQTEPTNIVPACKSCNSSKCDRDVWEWLEATGRTANPTMIERVHEGGCGALS